MRAEGHRAQSQLAITERTQRAPPNPGRTGTLCSLCLFVAIPAIDKLDFEAKWSSTVAPDLWMLLPSVTAAVHFQSLIRS